MSLDYFSRILEDSISPLGIRLTTYEVTFPRFMLAEFNTHRTLSRNSASSRAIPPEKQIERLLTSPFVPEFGTRVKGMGSGERNPRQDECVEVWLDACNDAVKHARSLNELGVDKSRINRLLEPFMWHTVIVTGVHWNNFFGLRTDEGAQPEFRIIAGMMLKDYLTSEPRELKPGEWHLPMITEEERRTPNDTFDLDWLLPRLSAGRTARVSFDTHGKYEPYNASLERAERLTKSAHWSPTEHQARVGEEPNPKLNGNLAGDWEQFRKMFFGEDDWTKLMGSATLSP